MDTKTHQVIIENETFEFTEIEAKKINSIELENFNHHILQSNKSYNVKIINADFSNALYCLEINGKKLNVKLVSETEQIISNLGIGSNHLKKHNSVIAPMPGLVLDILVKKGQTLKKGDNIMILEAMKMENIIKIQHDSTISEIKVAQGQAIEKGQILFELATE